MAPTDAGYLDDLTVHLQLAGLTGDEIGALVEETRDHLEVSGESPEAAFGPAEIYAKELAASRGTIESRPTRAGLISSALLVAGSWGLVSGLVALGGTGSVTIQPGHLLGWLIATTGLVWVIWPTLQTSLRGRTKRIIPPIAMALVLVCSVISVFVWTEPVLAELDPSWVIGAALIVITGSWLRAWRSREPIRKPMNR